MKAHILILFFCLPLLPCRAGEVKVAGPDGQLEVTVFHREGAIGYHVNYKGDPVIEPSPLGLEASIGNFREKLVPLATPSVREIRDSYTSRKGKFSTVNYVANELRYGFLNEQQDSLYVVFRVSNNDIAFRYEIASGKHSNSKVLAENTGFKFSPGTTTYITPQAPAGDGWMKTKPSYEEEYTEGEPVGTPSKYGLGYTFPALFHVDNNYWVLLSETGVDSRYVGTKLGEGTSDGLYFIAFPEPEENNGIGDATVAALLPLKTSWKTITVGNNLAPIVETTVATDVVEPLYAPSIDYQPGRSVWSWIVWQDASCNYDDQVTFIDLAAEMGYEYILVDALWDVQIGDDRMPALIRYAQSKGVDVWLWYNSNGAWNDAPQGPKNRMDTAPARQREMAWMKEMGVKGIKVDFFGGDKQVTMKLYEDILTDANNYGLMVNFHGTTLPRGWERMFPNFMTSEAVLASENLIFNQYFTDKEAYCSTVIPFTRNAVAPMDFGPVFFNKILSRDQQKGTVRRTTDAFQMATALNYFSPVQFLGITPNNLEEQPGHVIEWMKELPVAWDETRFVSGAPGHHCAIARRRGETWYVAVTNGTGEPLKLTLELPWLDGKTVTTYYDLKDGSAGMKKEEIKKGKLTVSLQAGGGAVLSTEE